MDKEKHLRTCASACVRACAGGGSLDGSNSVSRSLAVMRTLTLCVLMAIAGSAASQQAYPSKPIRLISPYPPGGSTSILARLFGQKLTESWGQQVIVENRGGGNTIIGTEALAKSPPDGYAIMVMTCTHVITPWLTQTPFDAIKDFAAVATLAASEQMLVVHPSVPASNLQEFIALAKFRPGQLNYATSASGSLSHLGMEYLEMAAGFKMQQIPYKGSGPALTDLIGGQVEVYLNVAINFIPHIKSGRLRAIAISGEHRLAALPEVPTFTEAGVPGLEMKNWYGILAPAGTSRAIIDKLSSEIAKILAMPDVKARLDSLGAEPFVSTPDRFAELMKADSARFGKIIKAANIKLEK